MSGGRLARDFGPQECSICRDTEPSHVHNDDERIEDYFTVGRGQTEMQAAVRWQRRAVAAERELVELVRAASTFANDKAGGISGDLGARLTDARAVIKHRRDA